MALCGDTTVPLIDETLNISETDESSTVRNIAGKLFIICITFLK